jgi:hypothetical protein
VNAQLTSKVGADLATSDAALAQLLDEVGSTLPPQERSLTALRGMLKATASGDPPTIRLTVVHRDPQRAAAIANAWAGVHILKVNELYGASADSSRYFEDQMAAAKTKLDDRPGLIVSQRNELVALQTPYGAQTHSTAWANESLAVVTRRSQLGIGFLASLRMPLPVGAMTYRR